MCCPDPGEKPAVKSTLLEDDATAERAAEQWARREETTAGSGTSTWRTDRFETDDGEHELQRCA